MYKAISMVVLAVGLSGATHVAQSPSDDRRLISRQSVKLTAEQEYVIRGGAERSACPERDAKS